MANGLELDQGQLGGPTVRALFRNLAVSRTAKPGANSELLALSSERKAVMSSGKRPGEPTPADTCDAQGAYNLPVLTGIILCGGRSTRMGADKGSLDFGGETMLARISRILSGVTGQVIIVGRRDQAGITTYDTVENEGPLGGIATALAASQTDLNLVVACDMPLIRPDVLERLVSMIGDADVCVAVNDEHASALCGVYRSRIAATAQALFDSGERRVMRLLDQVQTKRVEAALFRDLDPDLLTFKSLDTPDAYRDALKRLP